MLGTNGGGFFNANSAHPFENPNALTNLVQMVLIFSLGAALTNVFGRMVGNQRQGWAIFAVMGVLFLAGVADRLSAPKPRAIPPSPRFTSIRRRARCRPAAIWKARRCASASPTPPCSRPSPPTPPAARSTRCTTASCRSAGMVPMVNIMLGEIIFGGVGSGLYGMLLFAIVAVFVAGLMVGRTPEYLGKKIEAKEVKMAMLAILDPAALDPWLHRARGGAAGGPRGPRQCRPARLQRDSLRLHRRRPATTAAPSRASPPTRRSTTRRSALAMLIGRFLMIVPMLAVAGSLAAKKIVPASAGTFPTHGGLFVGLAVGVILIVGGLTFFPALALGPIVEHFAMHAGNALLKSKRQSWTTSTPTSRRSQAARRRRCSIRRSS